MTRRQEVDRAAGPGPGLDRIELLDILRGTALLGILLVNFNFFAPPVGAADRVAAAAIEFWCHGSFYPLFSLLFGLGFVIQVQRLEGRGVGVVPLYLRRLGALFLIGIAHAVLLWSGDVLQYYALLGVPLLLARRLPSRAVWVAVLLCLALWVRYEWVAVLVRHSAALSAWTSIDGAGDLLAPLVARESQALVRGDYGELVLARAALEWAHLRRALLNPFYVHVLAMFLFGLLAGRSGILERPDRHLAFLRRLLWAGLAIGVLGNAVYVLGPELRSRGIALVPARLLDFGGVFELGGDTALSLFYGAAVTLLVARHEAWQRRLAPLAAVGRMALTNYLLQSAVMLVLMAGFGFGLVFKIGIAASVPLRLALFAAQIVLSRWWLQRFRFGPMEWLWRAATYASIPPLRVVRGRP
jgi:uncharacterized protein